MRPLKPRMGRPMTILVAVLIWVVAMLIAVPQLLYFTTEYNPSKCILSNKILVRLTVHFCYKSLKHTHIIQLYVSYFYRRNRCSARRN